MMLCGATVRILGRNTGKVSFGPFWKRLHGTPLFEIKEIAAKGSFWVKTVFTKRTQLDMMYMPDAIDAAIKLMTADESRLRHRNAFNVTAMNFTPEHILHN